MDDTTALPPSDDNGQPAAEVPAIALGQTMPDVDRVPTLQPAMQALPVAGLAQRHSTLAAGLSFTGAARIVGSITVAGEVQGDLRLEQSPEGHVTITETGTVVGDINAPNIAVMGQAVGLLDASGGRVTLHESASVSGRIRYTHLQVNGADLNAQLERVRTDATKQG
jgi:cytoskeletal protein CcmA (bactofilin family)